MKKLMSTAKYYNLIMEDIIKKCLVIPWHFATVLIRL